AFFADGAAFFADGAAFFADGAAFFADGAAFFADGAAFLRRRCCFLRRRCCFLRRRCCFLTQTVLVMHMCSSRTAGPGRSAANQVALSFTPSGAVMSTSLGAAGRQGPARRPGAGKDPVVSWPDVTASAC